MCVNQIRSYVYTVYILPSLIFMACFYLLQSMRIFAGHKSTKLTEEDKKDMASLSKNISKNKPIKCRSHPTEQCKLFCIQCCVSIF